MLLVFLGGDLVVFGWHKERKWNVIWGLFRDKAASWNSRKSCIFRAQVTITWKKSILVEMALPKEA